MSPSRASRVLYDPVITRIANKLEPMLRRQFLSAVQTLQGRIQIEALAEAVLSGTLTGRVLDQFAKFGDDLAPAIATINRAFAQAGAQTAVSTSAAIQQTISFNLTNPAAVRWMQEYGAGKVREISEGTREAIQAVIAQGLEGVTPVQSAQAIRPLVGLTSQQSMAVINYRFRLLEHGVGPTRIAELADKYAARLHKQRAWMIARTETQTAVHAGQEELWRQGVESGQLDRDTLRRVWIVAPDACEEVCSPMADQRRPLGEDFTTGDGRQVPHPPAHVSCRCATGAVFDGD